MTDPNRKIQNKAFKSALKDKNWQLAADVLDRGVDYDVYAENIDRAVDATIPVDVFKRLAAGARTLLGEHIREGVLEDMFRKTFEEDRKDLAAVLADAGVDADAFYRKQVAGLFGEMQGYEIRFIQRLSDFVNERKQEKLQKQLDEAKEEMGLMRETIAVLVKQLGVSPSGGTKPTL